MPRFFSRGGVGVSGELWRHLKCALPSSFFFYPPLLTSSALARAEAPPSLIVSATWSSMWWMADKRFNGASVAQVVVFLFPSKIDGCPFVSDGHHQAPPLASPFENPFRIIRHLLCHQLFCFLLWCIRQTSFFFQFLTWIVTSRGQGKRSTNDSLLILSLECRQLSLLLCRNDELSLQLYVAAIILETSRNYATRV